MNNIEIPFEFHKPDIDKTLTYKLTRVQEQKRLTVPLVSQW